jgi:hypothetical protein
MRALYGLIVCSSMLDSGHFGSRTFLDALSNSQVVRFGAFARCKDLRRSDA